MWKTSGDIILLHMGTINQDHMMYGSWDIKDRVFVILGHFLPFDPPNNPENQSFEKMKKASGDIIILHSCTTKDHHIMYRSQDIQCNRQTFLTFWAIFCSFTP